MAAVHDHPDLRRARADPGLAARGVGGPRRQGLDHVPAGRPAARPPGRRRRLDLHLQPDPRRLHHARRSSRTPSSSATSSTTSSGWPATRRSRPPTRWSRSRSCSSTCSSPGASAPSRRSDGHPAVGDHRAPPGDAGDPGVHLHPDRDHRPLLVQRGEGGDLADHLVHPRLVRARRSATPGSGSAFVNSIEAAIGATLLALVFGSLLALAVGRHRFFGRETISLIVILPLALPGIVTGIALNTTFRDDRLPVRPVHDHRRARHVLRRRRLQQRDRAAAPDLTIVRGGLGRPRRRHVQDVPPRDVPGHPDGARRRRACSPSPCRSTRSS